MSGSDKGITRLDFSETERGVLVNKIVELPERAVVADSSFTAMTLAECVTWCQKNGWVTRQWAGGARAWKGSAPRPVRTAGQIRKRRAELEKYPVPGLQLHALDLAFDL